MYNVTSGADPDVAVNAGWIENTQGDFYFYRQGMTPAVTKIMHEIDKERVAIASEYGNTPTSCLQQMNTYYNLNCDTLHEFAQQSSLHSTMKVCPTNMQHRYLTEDLPYVLVPWYELGVKAGKESPFIRSLILWSSMINNTDYMKIGRNLKALGFADWSLDEIVDIVTATSDTLATELLRYKERGHSALVPEKGPLSPFNSSRDYALLRPKL